MRKSTDLIGPDQTDRVIAHVSLLRAVDKLLAADEDVRSRRLALDKALGIEERRKEVRRDR